MSRVTKTTNTFFYQQSNEIIIALIKTYFNSRKFYFKLGPNMAFVALPLLPRTSCTLARFSNIIRTHVGVQLPNIRGNKKKTTLVAFPQLCLSICRGRGLYGLTNHAGWDINISGKVGDQTRNNCFNFF